MSVFLRQLLLAISDIVFPRWCAGCGVLDTDVCRKCAKSLAGAWKEVSGHLPYIMHILPNGQERAAFPVWSMGEYRGVRKNLIIRWKNANFARLDRAMCKVFVRSALSLSALSEHGGPVVLIPAPSGRKRRREGRLIAKKLGDALAQTSRGVMCVDVLRKKETWPRFRAEKHVNNQIARGAKMRNTSVDDRKIRQFPAGSPVFLIDDVCTSGATLAGAAHILSRHGITVRGALVLAAAEDPRTNFLFPL